jgi:hypothetical protein
VRSRLAQEDQDTSGGKIQGSQALRKASARIKPVAGTSAHSSDVIDAINDERYPPVRILRERSPYAALERLFVCCESRAVLNDQCWVCSGQTAN